MRILRARVKPENADAWNRLTDEQITEHLVGTDGVLHWHVGRPIAGHDNEYVIVSLWRDMDAVRAFAGASGRTVPFRDHGQVAESITVEMFELE